MKIIIINLQKKIPIYPARIKKSLLKALKNEGVNKGEITVSFVGDKLISKLNLKYLNKNEPTDVLAFNLAEGSEILSKTRLRSLFRAKRRNPVASCGFASSRRNVGTRNRPARGGAPHNDRRRIPMLGDIIVSADTAARNSRIYKTSLVYELNLYTLHGCLHLLGYNDHKSKDKKIMRKKELEYYVHP